MVKPLDPRNGAPKTSEPAPIHPDMLHIEKGYLLIGVSKTQVGAETAASLPQKTKA